jgi:hypothetical protein
MLFAHTCAALLNKVNVANFILFVYAGEQCCSRGYKWWEKVTYHNLCNFVYYV